MHTCSSSLFRPRGNELQRVRPELASHAGSLDPLRCHAAIGELLGRKNYPCVPALRSYKLEEFLVGLYPGELGSGASSRALLEDLLYFREQQKQSGSAYMTFWAFFSGQSEFDETAFEERLWREISYVSSHQDPAAGWDVNFSDDPADPRFCPSFGGEAFFIVGMHPNSSRLARRFPFPTVVFNLYDQFEQLSREGRYESTVKTNRARELKFQGSLNPMVEQHGDKWEAIQFSGKDNPAEWKCPFQHGLKPPENPS
ncbi:guanitoxin biosynthesis heme-dependent pre-guanitoxin N-hydroxylase GntA [Hyalangium gracile]|uniref:guanitoxin biosynthesis heme-dependent pre-guanitoxin N-hydroxylase GntA n=1 Tax=Hyalangium gracile TaxID=394092 RepID=UPI001CCDC490|nr:guanitoxin biosynthesis heme-dependent pre-guanitoxin N-hydroxylase GntA [Hyalangium gracile]